MTTRASRGLTRRRFLVASGGLAAAAVVPGAVTQSASAAARAETGVFAVVADSHVDPTNAGNGDDLLRVLEHVAARPEPPAFVFHVGDVVEAGFPEEYEEADRAIPDAIDGLLRAVPGNHEVRWDAWAKQRYTEAFGPTPFSFDAVGLHVVGLDPTQLLLEPGRFGDAALRWLERDLAKADAVGTPSVLILHYPVGEDNFYVGDQDALWRAIAPFHVPAIFAGHVHRETVIRQNATAVITLPGVLSTPVYDWVERTDEALLVRRTEPTPEGGWREVPVVEVSLTAPRRRSPLAPRRVEIVPRADRSVTDVELRLGSGAEPAAVGVRIYPGDLYTWGTRDMTGWAALERVGPRRWAGALATGALAAGVYRLQVRVDGPTRSFFDVVERVAFPAGTADGLRVSAERDLGAPIQSGLATPGEDTVIAATIEGGVTALDISGSRPRERWSSDLGASVLGRLLVDPDGELVVAGTADRKVTALDASTGRPRWSTAVAEPALGSPAWAAAHGLVLAPAGPTVHALDAATGTERWRATVGGLVAGRPVADDDAVYFGAGDGRAHAFELATGERRWQRDIDVRTRPYTTLIYGPWQTQAALVPGHVVVSNVVSARALDRATGAIAWELTGGFMYGGAVALDPEGERLVLADEQGNVLLVEGASGRVLWRTRIAERVIGGAPTLWEGTIAVAGVNGLVVVLDPTTGATLDRLHVTTDYLHSAPAAAGARLAVGGQDGRLRVLTPSR